MRLLYFCHLAAYCEQAHVLAHALSMERERHYDHVPDGALSLKTCDRLELLESPIQIGQVHNALRHDSAPDEERLLEVGRRGSALFAGQDETRGHALLVELQPREHAPRREVGHPV